MATRRPRTRLLLGAALLACSLLAAAATTVYRWVDSAGRTHFSDLVPEAYRAVARPVDVQAAEPSDAERLRALQRAAEAKARIAPAATSAPPAASRPAAAPPAPEPVAKRPRFQPTEQTDCETWEALFQESADCFGPFRVVGGGIKPEAFDQCTPVVEPPRRCRRLLR